MGYIQASFVIDGALSSADMEFDTEENFDKWVEDCQRGIQGFPVNAAIFRLYHDHAKGIDCECIQFLTDHHPFWTYEGLRDD